ncbi:hypothetical protein ABEB36_006342 [Hypothenemus hampei]|uniref:CRAL-TRIO domain-containing protein n=1 Tax=Hypothenemus hampei TaxID=57062 RepID=A0ABD1EQ84_HYPHA
MDKTEDTVNLEDDAPQVLKPQVNLNEPDRDDEIVKWAQRHINEDPDMKFQLIQELRDMIFERGECDPENTEDAFLLKFLRARRFIVRMAHRLLVNYHVFKETNPLYFTRPDFKKILDIGHSDIFSVPPYTDQDGRRILFFRLDQWNTAEFTPDDLFQAVIFLVQAAILEPRHQIQGGVCIIDVANLSTQHAWHLTPTVARNILAVGYNSLPHRVEAVHVINGSRIFDYAFAILKPLLTDYVKQKIVIHQNLASLHEWIKPKFLPKRYGGVHKDYRYVEWLSVVQNNVQLIEEIEALGYEGAGDFVKNNAF